MNDDPNKRLLEATRDLSTETVKDDLLSSVAGAVQILPKGSILAALLQKNIEIRSAKKLQRFADIVATEIIAIKDRINHESIYSEGFEYICTKCFEAAGKEYQKSKIDIYRNILIDSMVGNVDFDVQEIYLQKVDQLSALHIQVLKVLKPVVVSHVSCPIIEEKGPYSYSLARDMILWFIDDPRVEKYIYSLAQDLDSNGITSDLAGYLNKHVARSGVVDWTEYLTQFGQEFVAFLRD